MLSKKEKDQLEAEDYSEDERDEQIIGTVEKTIEETSQRIKSIIEEIEI